ncbi:MAG: TetR/AcrR family transcriptional regulator C-terminal domain-containing protein [Oscillospiraceae bacterium]|nr:TetR/AcrR family transcriptional regulator C-terminal domain-containing protein [Oscillospiraceae bacterium]
MYHIKNDRRAWASARLICEALLHCLQTKPFHEITVSELQRVSSVSRSTFYRHFDSQSDVLALLCDLAFREIIHEFRQGTPIHIALFHYWYEHSLLLGALIQSGQSDAFIRSFRRSLKVASLPAVADLEGADLDYFLSTVACILLGILSAWIRRGRKETEEELLEELRTTFRTIHAFRSAG